MKIVETNKDKNSSTCTFKGLWDRMWWALVRKCPECGSRKLTEILTHGNPTWICEKCKHKVIELAQNDPQASAD